MADQADSRNNDLTDYFSASIYNPYSRPGLPDRFPQRAMYMPTNQPVTQPYNWMGDPLMMPPPQFGYQPPTLPSSVFQAQTLPANFQAFAETSEQVASVSMTAPEMEYHDPNYQQLFNASLSSSQQSFREAPLIHYVPEPTPEPASSRVENGPSEKRRAPDKKVEENKVKKKSKLKSPFKKKEKKENKKKRNEQRKKVDTDDFEATCNLVHSAAGIFDIAGTSLYDDSRYDNRREDGRSSPMVPWEDPDFRPMVRPTSMSNMTNDSDPVGSGSVEQGEEAMMHTYQVVSPLQRQRTSVSVPPARPPPVPAKDLDSDSELSEQEDDQTSEEMSVAFEPELDDDDEEDDDQELPDAAIEVVSAVSVHRELHDGTDGATVENGEEQASSGKQEPPQSDSDDEVVTDECPSTVETECKSDQVDSAQCSSPAPDQTAVAIVPSSEKPPDVVVKSILVKPGGKAKKKSKERQTR